MTKVPYLLTEKLILGQQRCAMANIDSFRCIYVPNAQRIVLTYLLTMELVSKGSCPSSKRRAL